jgi:hypothetical protein
LNSVSGVRSVKRTSFRSFFPKEFSKSTAQST